MNSVILIGRLSVTRMSDTHSHSLQLQDLLLLLTDLREAISRVVSSRQPILLMLPPSVKLPRLSKDFLQKADGLEFREESRTTITPTKTA